MFSIPTTTNLAASSVQYRRHQHGFRRISMGVRCSAHVESSTTYPAICLETLNVARTETSIKREMTLGENLRFVELEADGLVYKECFLVRGSQVGINKTATIETIASLLQETSCSRAQRWGWLTDGFPTPIMKKHRLIWITSQVHIEMHKYPAWSDVVEIERWWEPDGRIAARFDYLIRNLSTGEVIGRATRLFLSILIIILIAWGKKLLW